MLTRSDFRKASNYYLAAGSELLRPCLRVGARWRVAGGPTPPSHWKRGVLLGASHIGDVLYRSASLRALKAGLPGCEWHYLVEPGSAAVVETNPSLAGLLVHHIPNAGSRDFFALGRRLRAFGFDAAICYGTGTYWPELLLAAFAGIPNRVGYVHKGFSGLVTHPIHLPSVQSYSGYFRNLVAQLTDQPPEWSLRPTVATTDSDGAEAAAMWRQLNVDPGRPVLGCFVTTRQPHGQWARENYAQTIRLLRDQYRVQILLCGAAGDLSILEALKAAHRLDCHVIAGRLGLRPLVAFLRRCTGVFCTDSGPRHLANAAGVPVFFMRNLWSPKVETGAYLDTELDLAPDAERIAPGGEAEAFREITPSVVAARIAENLSLAAQ